MKQVIVIRKDLDMPAGKACAQAAHASVKAVKNALDRAFGASIYNEWTKTGHTKICLAVNSYEELQEIEALANQYMLINSGIIMDEGRTVFTNENGLTPTCLAIGPAVNSQIDKVTKKLRLY